MVETSAPFLAGSFADDASRANRLEAGVWGLVVDEWRYSVSCVEALTGTRDIAFEQGGVLRFLDLPPASGLQPAAASTARQLTHTYIYV
jgi:hypothetical protein